MGKRIGWGTLSLLFLVLGVFMSLKLGRTLCPGDVLLKVFGIGKFSRIHNTLYLSLALFITGYVLARRSPHNEGAAGKVMCAVLAVAASVFIVCAFIGIDLLMPLYAIYT